jgi:hypothetical protein
MFILLLKASLLCADDIVVTGAIDKSNDPSALDFYLLTQGEGEVLYERGGHTMLRVRDNASNLDLVFNWGMFDFNEPNFAINFVKGIQIYSLMIARSTPLISFLKSRDPRPLYQDKINLTPLQKERVMNDLVEWSKPENRKYSYRLWFANCSTQVRDILDKALLGSIKSQAVVKASVKPSFRAHSMHHLGTFPPLDLVADLMLNSLVDVKISAWDEMYLPTFLRDHFSTFSATNDDGSLSGPVLLERRTLSEGRPTAKVVITGHHIALVFSVIWIFGLFMTRFKQNFRKNLVACMFIGWGTMSFVFGTLMCMFWIFSMHTELHHNLNLLILWPTDLLIAAFGLSLLRKRTVSDRFINAIRLYAKLQMVGLALFFSAAIFTSQNLNGPILAVAPLKLLVMWHLIVQNRSTSQVDVIYKEASLQTKKTA